MLNAIYAYNDRQNSIERADRNERANIDPESVRRDLLAYELSRPRINWRRVVEANGDLDLIADEAWRHGDEVLARRARAASARLDRKSGR